MTWIEFKLIFQPRSLSTNVLLCICIQDLIGFWLKVARHLWLHGISIKIFVVYKAASHACLLYSHPFLMQHFDMTLVLLEGEGLVAVSEGAAGVDVSPIAAARAFD